ncbi:MAG TPA: transaldolase [Candidatus Saccharimonadales bacterium]|nr:transaldolase [Candidatus Saccharimonadales bacterium]
MSNLQLMYSGFQQSPWLDDLSRQLINDGKIKDFINRGIRGITSNPSIFEHALSGSTAYDEAIRSSALNASAAEDLYWQLAIEDIQNTADLLNQVYIDSNHLDGYVSLEVSPNLAQDSDATIKEARDLWKKVNRPNLMVKVPATKACLPAIKQLVSDGININVTLIFTLDRYKEVIDSYLTGLEECQQPLSSVHSVASFFVSRIDTEIDSRLEKIGTEDSLALEGKSAVASAQLAYEIFNQYFSTTNERWNNLVKKGANLQRPLWASTSTKNPQFDPLLYIKYLITSNTVSTIPEGTIALIESARPEDIKLGITPQSIIESKITLDKVKNVGVDLEDVGIVLEQQGIEKFQDAFNTLLSALSPKMNH